jgi:hypothetical protein
LNRFGQYCYTYLIGWRTLDVWYYGYRAGNKMAPSNDLWNVYPTSSQHVKDFRALHGEPDVVRVHRLFETKTEAKRYETRFIQRVNAVLSDRWLNKYDGIKFHGPSQFSTKSRKMMSVAKLGKKRGPPSIETRMKMSIAMKGKVFPPISDATRLKMSRTRKGRSHSIEHRHNLSEAHMGRRNSVETRIKISQTHLGIRQLIVTCPHCNVSGGSRALSRWHFDNCKVLANA